MTKATFLLAGHNPDVLNCIANLSNDKVFTPPDFANKMIDSLEKSWASDNDGASIWSNPQLTYLDPGTKSGVYLREIVKRLNIGLAHEIPDLSERINHIFSNQIDNLFIFIFC
jgi:site-specific DNA-methyltransferase (adenine-specific)